MNLLLNTFRLVAFFEGLSYILLLCIATPIKHFKGDPQYVELLGMPHGLLFISYIILAVLVKKYYKWDTKSFLTVLTASIIPFGTFYIDFKYLKN